MLKCYFKHIFIILAASKRAKHNVLIITPRIGSIERAPNQLTYRMTKYGNWLRQVLPSRKLIDFNFYFQVSKQSEFSEKLIKRLFHPRFLNMRLVIANYAPRWLFTISNPTRPHGIIVNYVVVYIFQLVQRIFLPYSTKQRREITKQGSYCS